MAASSSPTVRRRQLATELKRLRLTAKMTIEQVAEHLEWSPGKISKIENARVSVLPRDVRHLLDAYGVGDGPEREALITLARQSRERGWWQQYGEAIPEWFQTYVGLEAAASTISAYQAEYVPGLLQTEAYARAIIRLGNASCEEDVVRRAEARLARQDILNRENPPRLWAVVDEAALRRSIGGRTVMREQVRHLIDMADHPAVTLQILPFHVGSHPAMGGPFTILRYAEPDLRDVVYIEQLTSAIYLDKPVDVDSYLEVMEQLCLQAEPAAETQKLLTEILNSL